MWYVFAGMGSQWPSMGRAMMELEPFLRSIQRSDAYLQAFGMNLYQTIMEGDENAFNGVMPAFVGIVAIQVHRFLKNKTSRHHIQLLAGFLFSKTVLLLLRI